MVREGPAVRFCPAAPFFPDFQRVNFHHAARFRGLVAANALSIHPIRCAVDEQRVYVRQFADEFLLVEIADKGLDDFPVLRGQAKRDGVFRPLIAPRVEIAAFVVELLLAGAIGLEQGLRMLRLVG